jgi:hypothetical protein
MGGEYLPDQAEDEVEIARVNGGAKRGQMAAAKKTEREHLAIDP